MNIIDQLMAVVQTGNVGGISLGMARDEVLARLGVPDGEGSLDGPVIVSYKEVQFIFIDNNVAQIVVDLAVGRSEGVESFFGTAYNLVNVSDILHGVDASKDSVMSNKFQDCFRVGESVFVIAGKDGLVESVQVSVL